MGAVSLFVLGIISTAISRLLADEFKAWNPLIVRRLIQHAVTRLPENQRVRFDEEWSSHINEIPGEIGKLFAAFGFSLAARRIAATDSRVLEPFSSLNLFVIRLRDLFLSCTLILFIAPVYFLTFVVTKLDSRRPILIKTRMVGRKGRMFTLYKFRVSKKTLVGKFLYQFSLNELPVLFNILKGDMSLIGPAPERPGMVRRRFKNALTDVKEQTAERLSVMPGLTGWAQVNVPSSMCRDETARLVYDLYYIRNRTIKLDLLILWRALQEIFKGRY